MTRNEAIKWAKEIKALQEGKTIQFYHTESGSWVSSDDPGFSMDSTYRIKPEPREFWVELGERGWSPTVLSRRIHPTATVRSSMSVKSSSLWQRNHWP